jgi:ATP-dependent Clp protease ATP-binding subunit ClpA
MLSTELQLALNAAVREAQIRHHEYVTVEHVLFALLHDERGAAVLQHAGADIDGLKAHLLEYFDDSLERLADVPADFEPVPTTAFRRVLQRAILHVRSSSRREADSGDVLIAMFLEKDSHGVALLEAMGVSRLDVMEYVSHGVSKIGSDDASRSRAAVGASAGAATDEEGRPRKDPLELYCVELVARAAAGRLDVLVGREDEVQRMVHVLCRRRKNNPVLVGEPGVGKTAIVEGLAQRIHEGKVPEDMASTRIWALDVGALLAGTRYRGDFEERVKAIIDKLRNTPGAILFIDEIHVVIGAGSTSGNTMDAGNMLKPALGAGELRCIGSTTYEEYKHFEKDRALARRFQKIDVPEPSEEDSVAILKGLQGRYETHHGVRYSPAGIRAAVRLAIKHLHGRFLPDKAIDILDEAGAAEKLQPEAKRRKVVGPKEMEAVVARMARIPLEDASKGDRARLKALDQDLRRVVFGQDSAIAALVTAVKRSRAGLNRPNKPVGSFLFVGPTGVGKTELAKQLAWCLGIHFERFDMSEFMEKHAVARLIGAPPGYVGFEQGGLLVDSVRKHPHSVVLLDEIEKAHSDLFDLLLQVMDHAELTDNNGRKADFRHVTLIMTSNIGAREMSGRALGFEERAAKTQGNQAVERAFSPEFRNRLDGIVRFGALTREVMLSVVDKFMAELEAQLADKRVSIRLADGAREWLAEKGHDSAFGARPLGRLIQVELKDRLVDELLFGALQKGGQVVVDVEDGRLAFVFEPLR